MIPIWAFLLEKVTNQELLRGCVDILLAGDPGRSDDCRHASMYVCSRVTIFWLGSNVGCKRWKLEATVKGQSTPD